MSEDKKLTPEEFANLPKDQQEQMLKAIDGIQGRQKEIEKEEKNLKQMTMKEFQEVIGETVKKYIEPMTRVDRKYFMFPGIGNNSEMSDNTTPEGKFQKTRKFLNALVNKDVVIAREMSEEVRKKANLSESTATEGGFLVPEEFKAEVLRLAPEYGAIRANARIIPMRYDVMSIPAAGTTDQSAIWTNEAGTIKQTDPNFKQVQLVVSKLAALPKVTNELLADADISVIQYLAELIGEAFGKEEDYQGFLGVGAPFIGILIASGVPTISQAGGTVSALSYPDLVRATGKLYSNVLGNAKFYFHRSVIANIRSIITTTGAPIFAAQANEILGYPLVGVERLHSVDTLGASSGSAYGLFGDIRRGYAFGERGTMQMKISTEATIGSDNLFAQDMAAIRMIERIAMAVLLPSAFCTIKTA